MEVHADPKQDVKNTYNGYKFQTYLTFGEVDGAKTTKCTMVFENGDRRKVMHKSAEPVLTQWCTDKEAMKSDTEHHRFNRKRMERCSPWRLGEDSEVHYERRKKIYARCTIKRPFNMPGYAPLKLGQMLNVRSDIFINQPKTNKEVHAHFGWHAVPLMISSGAAALAIATGVVFANLF